MNSLRALTIVAFGVSLVVGALRATELVSAAPPPLRIA